MSDKSNKIKLKLDWATHEAAKYACLNWHYSKSMPVNKTVKIGVWENDIFIGVVIFSPGASANLYKSFKIKQTEGCELTRVALNKHVSPVSKILSLSLKILKKNNPGIKIVVSFADTGQNHHGGIYQATNWIYTGKSTVKNLLYFINGKWVHNKSVQEKYGSSNLKKIKERVRTKITDNKHRYVYCFCDKLKKEILKLSKPYPKRVEHESNAPSFHEGESSAILTDTLQ